MTEIPSFLQFLLNFWPTLHWNVSTSPPVCQSSRRPVHMSASDSPPAAVASVQGPSSAAPERYEPPPPPTSLPAEASGGAPRAQEQYVSPPPPSSPPPQRPAASDRPQLGVEGFADGGTTHAAHRHPCHRGASDAAVPLPSYPERIGVNSLGRIRRSPGVPDKNQWTRCRSLQNSCNRSVSLC